MKHVDSTRREFIPQNVRAWIYRVSLAVVPLLIAYGALDDKAAPLWVALIGAVLANGSAAVHTPTIAREVDSGGGGE